MRYWRHYPKFLQSLLLILMVFTLGSFSFAISGFCIKQLYDVSIESLMQVDENSPARLIAANQLVQTLSSIFTFLLSALLFAYLSHPNVKNYLGLRKVKPALLWPLTVLILICTAPVLSELSAWIQEIDFGTAAKSSQAIRERIVKSMMSGTRNEQLLLYLFMFALVPAIGEELLFRGVIMRMACGITNNVYFGIFFSAAIFGIAHGSVYQFVPIMIAGILLGYIYYKSGSIWLSILAHFTYNAITVSAIFLSNKEIISEKWAEETHLPWYIPLISLFILISLLSVFHKKSKALPEDWYEDFSAEERQNLHS